MRKEDLEKFEKLKARMYSAEADIWKLQNPPAFKKGDKVKDKYGRKGKIVEVAFYDSKFDEAPYHYYYAKWDWHYRIYLKKENRLSWELEDNLSLRK